MEMPSETVMVLNSTLLPPAPSTPTDASRASSPMCMLQGVTFPQVEATPICGRPKSSSRNPTARSMAREGACLAPSITIREYPRGSMLFFMAGPSSSLHRPFSGIGERALHPLEAEGAGGRHGERQQQRELSGAAVPPLECHVGEHADRWRQAAAHPRERDMHAHVVLRAADRGEVIVTEIPAKIGTRLGGAEQDRPDPQERARPAEHPGAHGGGREHDRPALPGAIAHHMRPVEQPRPPGHEEWLRDE